MTVCCCRCFCETTNAWIKINKKDPRKYENQPCALNFFSFHLFTTAADVAVGWRLLTSYVTLRFFLQIFCCCCYYDVSLAHAQNNTQQVFFSCCWCFVDTFCWGGMQMMWAEGVTYAVGDDLFSFRLSSLELC